MSRTAILITNMSATAILLAVIWESLSSASIEVLGVFVGMALMTFLNAVLNLIGFQQDKKGVITINMSFSDDKKPVEVLDELTIRLTEVFESYSLEAEEPNGVVGELP